MSNCKSLDREIKFNYSDLANVSLTIVNKKIIRKRFIIRATTLETIRSVVDKKNQLDTREPSLSAEVLFSFVNHRAESFGALMGSFFPPKSSLGQRKRKSVGLKGVSVDVVNRLSPGFMRNLR